MFTQNDWSPLTWTLMFTGLVFFFVALMGLLIFLVARAGEATSAPAAQATRARQREHAPPRHLRVPSPRRRADDTAPQAAPHTGQRASRGHVRAG
jgi:hypothetical protein